MVHRACGGTPPNCDDGLSSGMQPAVSGWRRSRRCQAVVTSALVAVIVALFSASSLLQSSILFAASGASEGSLPERFPRRQSYGFFGVSGAPPCSSHLVLSQCEGPCGHEGSRRLGKRPRSLKAPTGRGAVPGISSTALLPFGGGFSASFGAIVASELGDKTFFLTMIVALRRGRILALVSSLGALWLMTCISTGIGVLLSRFPQQLLGSEEIVRRAAAALMLFFGVQSLREAFLAEGSDEGLAEAETDFAEEEAKAAHSAFKGKRRRRSRTVLDVLRFGALIFLAEWGDRSMFATVALAASAKHTLGVLLGGCCGHAVAALFAVLSGELLQNYLSDRVIKTVGGLMFLIFAVTTFFNIY